MKQSALVVGPLCRFFAADPAEADMLALGVEAWMDDLNASLEGRLPRPIAWSESPAAPAHDFPLGKRGLTGVRLLAVYAERPEFELPDEVPARLADDPLWAEGLASGFQRSGYGHLLAAECWLPDDFDFTFRCPRPDGADWEFGSLDALRDQLRFLNQRTFRAAEATLAGWIDLPRAPEAVFFDSALRGLATFHAAAEHAARDRLPLALRQA